MKRPCVTLLSSAFIMACHPRTSTAPPAHVAVAPAPTPAPAAAPSDPEVLYFTGSVAVPGNEFTFMVELTRGPAGTTGTLHIPSQGARDVPLSDVVVDRYNISFTLAAAGARWHASRDDHGDPDECSFEQGSTRLECGMAKIDAARYQAMTAVVRPQTPKAPFDYDIVEVAYDNIAGGVKLAGTLTLPRGQGPHPAVLLVTGSGAQDRDETIFDHKPFWVIADHLARRGIATLRVDDRGVGGSTGDLAQSTTDDFVGDALAGVAFLAAQPRIDASRVGILGHSEGGLVGPAAALRSKQVRFVIMLAGPGVSGAELMPRQIGRVLAASGAPRADVDRAVAQQREVMSILTSERDDAVARARLTELIGKIPGVDPGTLDAKLSQLLTPWFRNFAAYDPRPALSKLDVPLLALNGELDVQVDAEQNATAIAAALRKGKNRRAEVRRMPGLNHLFQRAQTGAVAEYATIEQTIAPEVLETLTTWISAQR